MKKYIVSALVLSLAASAVGAISVSAVEFNFNRNKPTGMMERKEMMERKPTGAENEEDELKPTGMKPTMTPESCEQWKLRVVRRSTKLSEKKTQHLKVYAQLMTNLKMLMEKKGATAAQIAEVNTKMDALVAAFSADVDAQVAKMASAEKLDCTKTADVATFKTDLKALEEAVKDDIKAVKEYVSSVIRTYAPNRKSGRRSMTPGVSVSPSAMPSASPSATPVVVPNN